MTASTDKSQESHPDTGFRLCAKNSIGLFYFALAVLVVGWFFHLLGWNRTAIWFVWIMKWVIIIIAVLLATTALHEFRKRYTWNRDWLNPRWKGFFIWPNAITPVCLVLAVFLPRYSESWMLQKAQSLPPPIVATTNPTQTKIAEVNQKIANLIKKRAASQILLDKTIQERDALIEKLRSMGVNSTADVQRVSGGKKYTDSLQRIAAERDRYQEDVARFDLGIADANGVIRRLERAELGGVELDDEFAALSEQRMNLDETVDGVSTTSKPDLIQSADLLDRELQRKSAVQDQKGAAQSTSLIGDWEALINRYGGKVHLEFTSGGTATLRYSGIENIGTFAITGNQLTLTDRRGKHAVYALEVSNEADVLFREKQGASGDFRNLDGLWAKQR